MSDTIQRLATEYVEAAGAGDYDRLPALIDPAVEFHGPYVTLRGAGDFIAALRRLAPIRVRHDVRKTFVDGDDVCVIYDFVTDTEAGAVPFVEWLTFEGEKVRSSRLFFDREQFAPARAALQQRALGAAS